MKKRTPAERLAERKTISRAKMAKRAWRASGKTQIMCAVELGIGLTTFRDILDGLELRNIEKRQRVKGWIEQHLPE